jgi:hypothetical protein
VRQHERAFNPKSSPAVNEKSSVHGMKQVILRLRSLRNAAK